MPGQRDLVSGHMAFYVTTPIYYVNDAPHIGHAYTTVLADVLNRYHRLFGEETYFLTGTDEHGQKVQASAKARGLEPQVHCDEYVERFREIWVDLNVEPNFFIRTTMPFHKKVVREALSELYGKGDIYADEYEGWYSESEEMFYAEEELIDGKSPLGKTVVKIKEQNYFFRMGKYHQALLQHLEDYPEFILPKGKRSEVLGFLRQPLGDLCISRPKSRLSWGVELPFDEDYVTYVWFDALLNYASGIGYKQDNERSQLFQKFWPSAHHLIGKDILITHSVYWPTMLLALGVPLPKHIFAHGWWLINDQKMSKSEGEVVSPLEMKDIVGVDGLRYFLIRAMNPAQDGQFSKDLVINRVNTELSNNLGNLLSRTLGLVAKYFEGRVPAHTTDQPQTEQLIATATEVAPRVREYIENFLPNRALECVFEFLSETNKYLDELAPWKALKAGDKALGGESLYVSLECLRIVAVLLGPVMPEKMAELLRRIGITDEGDFSSATEFGLLQEGGQTEKGEPLFLRIE